MWSGPRNISTALMRAWENRGDCFVSDEPLYAHYLAQTGFAHPGAAEVMSAGETNAQQVIAYLTGEVPEEKGIWYQKHMAHHLLPSVPRDWMMDFQNCLLIRDPRGMLPSLLAVMGEVGIEATGLPQQLELFHALSRAHGELPLVLDSQDVLENPRGMLGLLCEKLGVPFTERMLSWPAGPRATDGVWAPYWYASVEKSTGFAPPQREAYPPLVGHDELLAECVHIYEELSAYRMRI